MIRSRIFLKLYAGYVLVILFCTTIVSLMIARQMQQDSLLDIENSLKSQAIILRESIQSDLVSVQTHLLQQHVLQITRDIDTRVTVIADDGTVIADSEQNPDTMDNHLNRPELQQAREKGVGIVSRFSRTLSKNMRYLALPISDNNQRQVYIRVALPLSLIEKRLNHLRNVVIVAASVTAIIALLLGFWIARNFANPLGKMTKMAQLLSTGNYKQRIAINRQDEIGELASTLNILAKTSSQREAVRRDFVANASHELKTPVTAIQGVAETLLETGDMNAETRIYFLQKIRDQSLRLSQIVSDLLALSRLESDETQIFDSIDITEIIAASCKLLQPIAKEKSLNLKFDYPDYKVIVYADEKSLHQMVVNLVDNAIKFTATGGEITVCLSVTNDQAIIEVKDDGIGIDPTEQRRIFERFYCVDKARSRLLGGTGLGLAIVKHIAMRHHGNVEVESKLNHGATFRVYLPIVN